MTGGLFSGGAMLGSATISPCGQYRLELRRVWDETKPLLVVVMLNPSDADAERNDPTVLALIHFGKLWGYGGLLIVNLYALRTSSPAIMMAAHSNVGPGNGDAIEAALSYAAANGGSALAAWGNDGNFEGRADWLASRANNAHRVSLVCLGRTLSGAPKHPMARGKHRISRDQMPVSYRPAGVAATGSTASPPAAE